MAWTRLKDRQTDKHSESYIPPNCKLFLRVYKEYIILGSYRVVPLDMVVQVLPREIWVMFVLRSRAIRTSIACHLMAAVSVFVKSHQRLGRVVAICTFEHLK